MTTGIAAVAGGILIGILITIALVYLTFRQTENNFDLSKFKKSQSKVLQDLQEKKDTFDKELSQEQLIKREELRQALEQLQGDYTKQQQSYEEKTEELVADYQRRRKEIQELDAEAESKRTSEQAEKIQAERDKYNEELNRLSSEYKDKRFALDQDFLAYSEQVSLKRETLTKEIQDYEDKQKEIIARFKEDEEKRQQANFYKIKVSEIEKQDVIKLKVLSTSFSKPEILLKLIYETYYKTRLEEVFKRVLGENRDKGGIYKITNVNNQKVYIGKTTNFLTRWRTHAKRGCGIERIKGQLYDAMFDEGLENFTWEVVEVCPKDVQTEKEKYWTNFYKSNEYGYNVKVG